MVAGLACDGGKARKKTDLNKYRKRADGWAKIYDNDTALARDKAIREAKNNLVKNVLGETVSGTSTVKNYRLVKSLLKAKSHGLVRDEKVVKKNISGGVYFFTVEGTVLPTAVDDAIQTALENYGKPKFMVLIDEKFDSSKGLKRNTPGFTETEVILHNVMSRS